MRRPLSFVLVCLCSLPLGGNALAQQVNITFQGSQVYEVAKSPKFLALADFNGDGLPDVVVSSPESNKVTVLISDGAGGFSGIVSSGPYGTKLGQVAAGDLNDDGVPDVAVTDFYNSQVWLLAGNRDGTLGLPTTLRTGAKPYGVTIGQFDGGSGNDVAVSNSGDDNVSVFFNRGTGRLSFTSASNFPTSHKPQLLLTADFTDDGNDDIAALNVGNQGANDVTELMGNGSGGFQSKGNFVVGDGAQQMAVADFNNDFIPDIAVVNGRSSSTHVYSSSFNVLLSDGLGFFNRSKTVQIDCPSTGNLQVCLPRGIAAADFDLDGNVDIAVAIAFTNSIIIFAGDGLGNFDRVGTPISTMSFPTFLMAGDFDGDGLPDLVVAQQASGTTSGNIQVFRNTTVFPTPTRPPSPTPTGTPPTVPPHATSTATVGPPITPSRQLGQVCSVSGECFSGFCVDGRCCNTACDLPSQSCDLPEDLGICTSATETPTFRVPPSATPGGGQGSVVVARSGGCSTADTSGSLLGQVAMLCVPVTLWLGRRRNLVRVPSRARRCLR